MFTIPTRWKIAVKNICPLQNKGNLEFKTEILTNLSNNPKTMAKTSSEDIYK